MIERFDSKNNENLSFFNNTKWLSKRTFIRTRNMFTLIKKDELDKLKILRDENVKIRRPSLN